MVEIPAARPVDCMLDAPALARKRVERSPDLRLRLGAHAAASGQAQRATLASAKTPDSNTSSSPSSAWPPVTAGTAAQNTTAAPAARHAAVVRRRRCWRRT